MAETYCGKNCQDCTCREKLACPGCKIGPGRPMSGDCDLAGCAWRKGCESCAGCDFRSTCSLVRRCEEMPAKRLQKQEYAQYRREQTARNAPVLGKWLWVLFWLVIPSTIGELLTQEFVTKAVPSMYLVGILLKNAITVVYSLILLKMGDQVSRYRTAGICGLVCCGITLSMSSVISSLLLAVPGVFMAVVFEYQEYTAHSDALTGVDYRLSNRWSALWKWNLAVYGTMVVGIVLTVFFLSLFGVVLMLLAGIGILVLSVLKLVYLYQSARFFRRFRE